MSIPGNAWRRLHGHLTSRPTNFSWIVPDLVAGSGRPMSGPEVRWMAQQGVACIVSMTETALPARWLDGIEYLHLPTPDMTAPKKQDIDRAVSFIEQNTAQGRPVAVHCAAGLGRAGTILACYMVRHHKIRGSEAIKRLRSIRPGSIQSSDQIEAVLGYL